MKIRTITTGINISSLNDLSKINKASEINNMVKSRFENEGYEVQTTRISTNSWEDYFAGFTPDRIISEIINIESICKKQGVTFFNIGYTNSPKNIEIIPDINKATSIITCSSKIGDYENGINFENAKESAKAIKRISEETQDGYGNFRFGAWANCKSGIPFYPVSYHAEKETIFAIGLECGDLAMKAFSKSKDINDAEKNLKEIFELELQKVERIAEEISAEIGVEYKGIDSSLAPSINKDESIAFAYEKLGFGKFGAPGSLAISGMITRVLKNLSVKTCGYSGLMLPVCEDYGLAERANDETYSVTNLLLYSAVCGCGLDTVPIPGDTTVEQIEAILLDMATLAIKLNKPLAARLFPVPRKLAGQKTSFNSPYLIDCSILRI